MEAVLEVAIEKIRNHFSVHSFFILQDGNNTLYSNGLLQKEKKLAQAEYEVAEWSFKQGKIAGRHTAFAPETLYTFFPLSGTRINPGVLAIQTEKPFREEQKSYWDTFLALISNALEREFLGELAQKVRFLDESDRLYKTLFNSISHELRIPVATIMGASETILHNEGTVEIKSELCKEIVTASLRLNRLIENLLNMSRLESGHIRVRLDWCDMNDLFNKVLEDLADELKPFSSEVFIAPEMPLVKVDFGLMEQVLYNLVYNSTQYTPQGLLIRLSAKYENGKMFLEIADQGPGFPENEIRNVFKKFSRIDRNKTGGLGLGLSIAKGFIQAHNGIIEVENRTEGGACFTIAIPSDKLDFETM